MECFNPKYFYCHCSVKPLKCGACKKGNTISPKAIFYSNFSKLASIKAVKGAARKVAAADATVLFTD